MKSGRVNIYKYRTAIHELLLSFTHCTLLCCRLSSVQYFEYLVKAYEGRVTMNVKVRCEGKV